MGQIVKRRKKGRQSDDSDLFVKSKSPAPESDYRRSLRRRNARPIIDYDDYLDEYEEEMMLADEEEDDDDEEEGAEDAEGERISSSEKRRKRKKKKLQSVVKLAQYESDSMRSRRGGRGARVTAVEDDEDDDYEAEAHNDLDRENDGDEEEESGRKGGYHEEESNPGTPVRTQIMVPLPDKKLLELILDKLQKKDIYGVYAEPVDPEELPDYFDIIKHPMDFATVRKKLANGKYSTVDQIEKDVLLICSNAMRYNEPDTVYYKQARTIQEMARKKFDRVRSDFERLEKQINTEVIHKFNHNRMNPIKRSICRSSQKAVGSDFQSDATLSTPGESHNGLNLPRFSSFGKPFSSDGPVEGNVSAMDNDVDKAEEFVAAKNISCKVGKKPLSLGENHRNAYKIANQLSVASDSIFTTFEKEPKELVSVGLQAEYSYARSLARFAGTLGPVAWNIAAKNIKEALSQGVRFGRGWVGEYEPISTPFLKVDSQSSLGSACPTALPNINHLTVKVNQKSRATGPFNFSSCYSNKDHPVNEPVLEARPSFIPVPDDHTAKRKPPSIGFDGRGSVTPLSSINPGKNPFSRSHLSGGKVGIHDVSFRSTTNPDKASFSPAAQLPTNSFVVSGHGTSQPLSKSTPSKKAENGGLISSGVPSANVSMSTFEKNRLAGISPNNVSGPAVRSAATSGYIGAHQGVNDPVHQRMLAEKAQNQPNCGARSAVNLSPAMPAVPSSRKYNINNGSQVSPRSWMSIGSNNINKAAPESPRPLRNHISADSLYNSIHDVQQVSRVRGETPGSVGLHFQMEKNHISNHPYGRENHWFAKEAQLQGHSGNMTKLVTADLSRFQVQSPRQSLNIRPQTRQTFPPDLNVGFPSSGSPTRQVTQVDPQQPDLALQL